MQPGDFKRKYNFRSDPKRDRRNYTIAIVVSVIAFLLIWFYL